TMPPAWLPPEDEEDEEEHEIVEATGQVFEAPLRQVALPMGLDDEEEEEVEAPAPQRPAVALPWTTPPIDLLMAAPPADESARPDNNLRASLIVETLASFGVDSRVAAFHEGPVVTQFDVEPGWEVKYKTIIERDKDNKIIVDKDGR